MENAILYQDTKGVTGRMSSTGENFLEKSVNRGKGSYNLLGVVSGSKVRKEIRQNDLGNDIRCQSIRLSIGKPWNKGIQMGESKK